MHLDCDTPPHPPRCFLLPLLPLSIIISVLVLILACVYNFVLAQSEESFLLSLRAPPPRGLGLSLMVCETALKRLDTHLLS